MEHWRYLVHLALWIPAILRRERRQSVCSDIEGGVRVRQPLLGRDQRLGKGLYQESDVCECGATVYVQVGTGASLDQRQCGEQQEHSRNGRGAAEEELCQVPVEARVSRGHGD